MSSRVHACEHTVGVAAPAGVVYGMLADAVRWPVFLPSVVHVERLDFDGVQERLRMWELADDAADVATDDDTADDGAGDGAGDAADDGAAGAGGGVLGGRVGSWHARRVLHPDVRAVVFEQEDAVWPGSVTSGVWSVRPAGEAECVLGLRQECGLPVAAADGARREAEADVHRRLAQVRRAAGWWERLDELLLSFEDRVRIEGPAELVYDFLYRIGEWPGRVPHVERAGVREDVPGIQVVSLDSCAAPGGRTVSTRAVRLCFPHAGRIVYKETLTSELIAAHSGEWSLLPDAFGVTVVAAHQVMLRQEAVGRVLGAGTGLLEARDHVRAWLSRASTETLGLAKWHAESTVRRLR
ncbi:SRPBCC family protein [Streptomyces mirabilis]|uniref:SRPBCC family protein n=1 Tax=Streptomyces mirabilis TaxID=68239 RepID=UPI00332F3B60